MVEKYGFAILSVLALLRGLLMFIVGLGILGLAYMFGISLFGNIALLLGSIAAIILFFVLAIFEFALAYGFWHRPKWAFWVGIVIYGLGVILSFIEIVASRSIWDLFSLATSSVILGYIVANENEFE